MVIEERDRQPQMKALSITLPEHVICDRILPKLPVKSLLRFKSVSKEWLSLISSPKFIKTHLTFSSSARNEFLLDSKREYFTLSYDEHDLTELMPSGDEVHKLESFQKFVGCCNGLVCIYILSKKYSECHFVIWNPAMRVYKKVALPSRTSRSFHLDVLGFGYASADDDYKIVDVSTESSDVRIFSMKQGKWKVIDPKHIYVEWSPWSAVYVDDTLLWKTSKGDHGRILSCNLVTEEFKVIPDYRNWVSVYRGRHLHVIRGRLAMCCFRDKDGGVDVWIRKRIGGLPELWEWENAFVITNKITRYMAFSQTGKCLVKQSNESSVMLKLVDPTTGDYEQNKCIDCKDCEGLQGGKHYFQSLISPFAIKDRKPRKRLKRIKR